MTSLIQQQYKQKKRTSQKGNPQNIATAVEKTTSEDGYFAKANIAPLSGSISLVSASKWHPRQTNGIAAAASDALHHSDPQPTLTIPITQLQSPPPIRTHNQVYYSSDYTSATPPMPIAPTTAVHSSTPDPFKNSHSTIPYHIMSRDSKQIQGNNNIASRSDRHNRTTVIEDQMFLGKKKNTRDKHLQHSSSYRDTNPPQPGKWQFSQAGYSQPITAALGMIRPSEHFLHGHE